MADGHDRLLLVGHERDTIVANEHRGWSVLRGAMT